MQDSEVRSFGGFLPKPFLDFFQIFLDFLLKLFGFIQTTHVGQLRCKIVRCTVLVDFFLNIFFGFLSDFFDFLLNFSGLLSEQFGGVGPNFGHRYQMKRMGGN